MVIYINWNPIINRWFSDFEQIWGPLSKQFCTFVLNQIVKWKTILTVQLSNMYINIYCDFLFNTDYLVNLYVIAVLYLCS